MATLKRIAIAVIAILALLYPLLVYLGMQHFEPKILGAAIAALYILRALIVSKSLKVRLASLAALLALAALMWWANHEYMLTFLPALISACFLGAFAYSYFKPPTIPARFAMKLEGELRPEQVRYTNKITLIWMAFFVVNIVAATYTALYLSQEMWALYNGFIAYLLMGALFLGEYVYRTFCFEPRVKSESL